MFDERLIDVQKIDYYPSAKHMPFFTRSELLFPYSPQIPFHYLDLYWIYLSCVPFLKMKVSPTFTPHAALLNSRSIRSICFWPLIENN